MTSLADIQRHVGVPADGLWGPQTAAAVAKALGMREFDRTAFLSCYINKHAPAITDADIDNAARRLNVTTAHIRMLREVESDGRSFDPSGRPIILFEPHQFYKRTGGAFGVTSFSYPKWRQMPYPKTQDARWEQLADAAECDEASALESASWGLFQVMGFNWQDLDYSSVHDFCRLMVESEANHLDAMVRFITVNALAPALRRCRHGDPESCEDFARGYNGAGYATNDYHGKMARAL